MVPKGDMTLRPGNNRTPDGGLDQTMYMGGSMPGQNAGMGAMPQQQGGGVGSEITIFDGPNAPYNVSLNALNKDSIIFGRMPKEPGGQQPDIILRSGLVSRPHGRFVRAQGAWYIEDGNSTNGLIVNGQPIKVRQLLDGDMIRIDNGKETMPNGVLMLVTSRKTGFRWQACSLNMPQVVIGRAPDCALRLEHVSVSKHHAMISRNQDGSCTLTDCNSTNGVYVNGERVIGKRLLHEKDVITITNTKLIFTSACLYYCIYQASGISVEVADVVVRRGSGKKSFITSDHVTLRIDPGELVSIIGGSGAGKSTILNAMCGYLKPAEGHVYINGVDLYQNFDALKKLIGYVPQQDIVFDTLSLYDTLLYTAKLRLPEDTSPEEREKAIDRAIAMVELTEKKNSFIKDLSGGQRKRASIAVELLSDPSLLFLDEPCSGLDPGTERSLMNTLRQMANNGKTIILVTHSTLQLKMCDKIVFMGKHGKLCYCGPHDSALQFFHVENIVDCYDKMNNESTQWQQQYNNYRAMQHQGKGSVPSGQPPKKVKRSKGQLAVLTARYMKLTFNDRSRLILLLALVPVVVILISLVKTDALFDKNGGLDITRNLMFVLSCSCFFLGMFGSISEISKERTIVRREYMTGMSLTMYVLSKLIVLALICLVQSLLITALFAILVGVPDPQEHLITEPIVEMFVTTFLLELSSSATGLLLSALVPKPDLGVTITVVLLMPQILFSGLIFKLEGLTDKISWFTVCRWGMEGFGSTSDLNAMTRKISVNGMEQFTTDVKDMFEPTSEHLWKVWAILAGFVLVCTLLTRIAMKRIDKD